MTFRTYILTIFLISGIAISGCYYDNIPDLYPNGCNTDVVSYTDDIVPILNINCISCHNQLTEQGGINLQGYDNVIEYVDDGRLLGSVRHDEGFEPMPLTGGKISLCSISKIEAWIEQGALDN